MEAVAGRSAPEAGSPGPGYQLVEQVVDSVAEPAGRKLVSAEQLVSGAVRAPGPTMAWIGAWIPALVIGVLAGAAAREPGSCGRLQLPLSGVGS